MTIIMNYKVLKDTYTYKNENGIFLKKNLKKMSKTSIVLIIYILGLIFGALVLGIWSAETSVYKGLLGLGWTALALIGLFFAEKNENN